MADITKCKGTDCPIKEKCYRYTANIDGMQSWFVEVPFKIENNAFTCDMFWGENAERIFKQLNDVLNKGKNLTN